MLRSFSLIEFSITLFILSLSIYLSSPILFNIQDSIIVRLESNNIKNFIYYIQSKARMDKNNYSILLSQKANQYCIIAIKKELKEQISCNCLDISSCNNKDFYLYKNSVRGININKKKLYPNILLDIDGRTGGLGSDCISLYVNRARSILQFSNLGVINVSFKSPKSRCTQ